MNGANPDATKLVGPAGDAAPDASLLDLLVVHSPGAFAMFDRGMHYLLASERWKLLFDLGAEDLLGRCRLDARPVAAQRWSEACRADSSDIGHMTGVDTWAMADGRERWLEWDLNPWRQPDGEVGGVIVLVKDVTDRRLRESAEHESSWRRREMLDECSSLIYATDIEGKLTLANRKVAELLGRSHEELVGMDRADLMPIAVAKQHRANDLAVLRACSSLSSEETHPEADGMHTYLSVKFPLRDSSGTINGVGGISTDITARKAIEYELREKERQLEAAQALAKIGTFERDARTGAGSWSAELFRIFERDPQLGVPTKEEVIEYFHPDDRHLLIAVFEGVLSGETYDVLRFRSNPERLTAKWFEATISTRWQEQRPAGYTGVVQDVSERVRAQEALSALTRRLMEAEDRERRRIAKELHDSTAQDLIGVVLALDALQADSDPKLAPALTGGLGDAIAVLEHCVHDIRTLAYVLHPPILEEAGLAGAIRDYAGGFGRRTGICMTVEVSEGFGRLPDLHELVLFRVVQESLGNIHRHSQSPTAIVRLERALGSVRLEVEDAGQGASPERFADGGDAGVGVAAMRERIRQLGGRLEIESGSTGTRVRASVPEANV